MSGRKFGEVFKVIMAVLCHWKSLIQHQLLYTVDICNKDGKTLLIQKTFSTSVCGRQLLICHIQWRTIQVFRC